MGQAEANEGNVHHRNLVWKENRSQELRQTAGDEIIEAFQKGMCSRVRKRTYQCRYGSQGVIANGSKVGAGRGRIMGRSDEKEERMVLKATMRRV